MRNFNLPYFSRSPSEFWQRWHISLSSWLRDYLYISLGGNRQGNGKTYRNLMLTMLLGGLWHGAAWNYILWGAYQGSILVSYRALSRNFKSAFLKPVSLILAHSITSWLLFFSFTCYGWLLFRAESLSQIIQFTKILILGTGGLFLSMDHPPITAVMGIPILIGFEVLEFRNQSRGEYLWSPQNGTWITLTAQSMTFALMTFLFVGALSTPPVELIYFQF